MSIHTLRFGDEGQAATRELLARYDRHAAALPGQSGDEPGALRRDLATLERLERQLGGSAQVDLAGTEELVSSLLTRLSGSGDPELVLGVALWAIRHGVQIVAVEPVANALALRSNAAASRAELSAVVGLMHGVVGHVRGRLAADLERSNPERPWRVLHANLAITAIRTEDPQLMELAFDALDAALPDERANFYAEALALALAPGISPGVRAALEARHRRWTA
jgi:hypothetical protein